MTHPSVCVSLCLGATEAVCLNCVIGVRTYVRTYVVRMTDIYVRVCE